MEVMEKPHRRVDDTEVVLLRIEVKQLNEKVDKLTENVADLVKAWNTAQGMTSFVKWLSTLVLSCGAIYAAIRGIK